MYNWLKYMHSVTWAHSNLNRNVSKIVEVGLRSESIKNYEVIHDLKLDSEDLLQIR